MKRFLGAAAGSIVALSVGLWAQVPAPVKPAPAKPASGKPATGVLVEYTAEQSAQGKAAYDQNCASCHGRTLDNG